MKILNKKIPYKKNSWKILLFIIISIFLFGGSPIIIKETKMNVYASIGSGAVHVSLITFKNQTCQTTPACAGACALCGGCGPHDQLQYNLLFGMEPRSEKVRGCPSIGFKPMYGNGMCDVGEIIFGLAKDMTMGKITPADAINFYCGAP